MEDTSPVDEQEDPGDGAVVALASSPGAGSRTTGIARLGEPGGWLLEATLL